MDCFLVKKRIKAIKKNMEGSESKRERVPSEIGERFCFCSCSISLLHTLVHYFLLFLEQFILSYNCVLSSSSSTSSMCI